MKRILVAGLLVLSFAGCAQLSNFFGATAPQGPSQSLAYAYGTVATVRQSAATALQSGTISVATAQIILADTDKARAILDTAETMLIQAPPSSTPPNISTYLAEATTLLTAAQKLLPQPGSAVAGSGMTTTGK